MSEAECVVLLHGLARSDASLMVMEAALRKAGYEAVNQGYPSTEASIEELARIALPPAVARCGGRRTHFVTHSMGGILVRAWLEDNRPARMGRVVMLGPPNKGSEVVDAFSHLGVFEWFHGPAGMELGTGVESTPNRLGLADCELGIIAGSRSLNPVTSAIINKPNDGTVSVESTMLEGMTDHIVLPTTHTFMMNNPLVIAQVLCFLRRGRFSHDLTMDDVLKSMASWDRLRALLDRDPIVKAGEEDQTDPPGS